MNSIHTITTFLGWSTLINLGMLVIVALCLAFMRGFLTKFHGKIYGLSDQDLARAYFQYLAQYKIVIIVFNLVPYIALKIMA